MKFDPQAARFPVYQAAQPGLGVEWGAVKDEQRGERGGRGGRGGVSGGDDCHRPWGGRPEMGAEWGRCSRGVQRACLRAADGGVDRLGSPRKEAGGEGAKEDLE